MEWKELKIDKCSEWPDDLLTGGYEFEYRHFGHKGWHYVDRNNSDVCGMLRCQLNETYVYRYRKHEPLPPTHEEIMTKWWEDDHGSWYRVLEYIPSVKLYVVKDGENDGYTKVKAEGFTGRESAVIPPEDLETGEREKRR